MLIQALLKLIGFNNADAWKFFGFAAGGLPELTGKFDNDTIQTIWAFQRKMAYRLLNVDGKIDPVSYENRVLKKALRGRLMAITLLNMEAKDTSVMLV